jgi:RNA polymerase-binding transcription factor DksA
MDLVDKGNDAEQLLRNTEIDNYINRVRPQRVSDSCIDCDEPIPAERLNAGGYIVRCIDCQYIYELKKKQGRL